MSKKISTILFSLVIGVYVMIWGTAAIFDTRDMGFDNEQVGLLNDGWFYQAVDGTAINITLPCKLSLDKAQKMTIKRILSENIAPGMVLAFRSSQQEVYVSIDDRLFYSFEPAKQVISYPKSPTSAWHLIDLPDLNSGETLSIELKSPYQRYTGSVNEVMIGTKSAILYHLGKEYFPALCVSMVILLIGAVFILFGLYSIKKNYTASFLYLGLFAVFLGLWFFGESKVIQFFSGNVLVPYQIVFMSLTISPIPILMFVRSVYRPKEKPFYDWLIILAAINFLAMVLCQSMGVWDFYQWVSISHLFLLAAFTLVLYTMFKANRQQPNYRAKYHLIGCLVFFLFGLAELLSFYIFNTINHTSILQVGIIFFLMIMAMGEVRHTFELIKMGKEAELFKRVARTDHLTQLENRYAFDRALDDIASQIDRHHSPIFLCVFDVDNLKQVNDTMGHSMGDELIRAAASCIQSAFGRNGKCYRIGGDEFAVILCGDEKIYQQCYRKLNHEIEGKNGQCSIALSISIGAAQFDAGKNISIYDVFRKADAHMYHQKKYKKTLSRNHL